MPKIANRTQKLSGNECQIIVKEQIQGEVFDFNFRLAIVLYLEFQLRFEKKQVLILEMEDWIEATNGKRADGVRLVNLCRRPISGQMND